MNCFNENYWWEKKAKEDIIPGGLADQQTKTRASKSQLKAGIKAELEHTNNKAIAKEIAMDHLVEDPEYYTKLKEMEKEALLKQAVIKKLKELSQRGYRGIGKGFEKIKTNPYGKAVKEKAKDVAHRSHEGLQRGYAGIQGKAFDAQVSPYGKALMTDINEMYLNDPGLSGLMPYGTIATGIGNLGYNLKRKLM